MPTYRLKPLWSKILGIALAVVLVASVIGTIVLLCKPWRWLLIPGLCGVVYFAFEPAFKFIKGMIEVDVA